MMDRNMGGKMDRKPKPFWAKILVLVGTLLPATMAPEAAAQVTPFIIDYTDYELVELDISTEGEISETQRWDIPESIVFPFAMEIPAGGPIYIVSAVATSGSVLVSLDRETGVRESLASFPIGFFRLALQQDGRLWVLEDEELHLFDPESGTLTLQTLLPTPAFDLGGMAWLNGELYVLIRPAIPGTNPSLARVDTDTGAFTDTYTLPGLAEQLSFPHTVHSMDFDEDGGLWIGFNEQIGDISSPTYQASLAHYADPWMDSEPTISTWPGVQPIDRMPVAVTGRAVVIDVPGLNSLGMVILALGLASAALLRTRRLRNSSAKG